MKTIFCILILCLSSLTAAGQETRKVSVYFFGEIADASQFSYKAPQGGLLVGGSYRLSDRITLLGEYGYEWSEKTFLDNGHTEQGSLGARLYLIPDRLFAQVKGAIVSHQNDEYVKTVARANVGIGVHAADFTATLSFFTPANSVVVDPNTVRGASITVDYERSLFGPVSVITSGQIATASFTGTNDFQGDRIRGQLYSARTGFAVRF
jgi:hypothetical protein